MTAHFKILVVCLGNVCRSPLAERVLRYRLAELLGDQSAGIEVSSAGVRALVGSAMDQTAAHELRGMGISPDGSRARQLDAQDANEADLVLTADKAVRSRVLEETPRALNRTFTIRELSALVGAEGSSECVRTGPTDLVKRAASRRGAVDMEGYDIPDPIGQSADVHRQVAALIDQDCSVIASVVAEAVRCGVQAAAE